MFEPMDETEAAKMLITVIRAPITAEEERKGTPHVFKAVAVDNLVRTAEGSKRRETVQAIADALRGLGYRNELERVERKLDSMPREHNDRKGNPLSRPPARGQTGPQKLLLK